MIDGENRLRPVTVASYGRRRHLVEEVPGLCIRRLTLEDPKSAREPSSSRSQSPGRHICHPTSGYVSSGRVSSSYRYWLEGLRKERPAFLTIISLELPESPIPLIESQTSIRSKFGESNGCIEDKDHILDELLEKVTDAERERVREWERESRERKIEAIKRARRNYKKNIASSECTKEVATLEECTRNIVEGSSSGGLSASVMDNESDCICSEIPKSLRIGIHEETEATRSSRSPSPEIGHTIRIAMKYHRGQGYETDEIDKEMEEEERGEEMKGDARQMRKSGDTLTNVPVKGETIREDGCCSDVNAPLDFTLNCSSVRLTSRDVNFRSGMKKARKSIEHDT